MCKLTEVPCSVCCRQSWQQTSGFVSVQSWAGFVNLGAPNSFAPRLRTGCREAVVPCKRCPSPSSSSKEAAGPLAKGRGFGWPRGGSRERCLGGHAALAGLTSSKTCEVGRDQSHQAGQPTACGSRTWAGHGSNSTWSHAGLALASVDLNNMK